MLYYPLKKKKNKTQHNNPNNLTAVSKWNSQTSTYTDLTLDDGGDLTPVLLTRILLELHLHLVPCCMVLELLHLNYQCMAKEELCLLICLYSRAENTASFSLQFIPGARICVWSEAEVSSMW